MKKMWDQITRSNVKVDSALCVLPEYRAAGQQPDCRKENGRKRSIEVYAWCGVEIVVGTQVYASAPEGLRY